MALTRVLGTARAEVDVRPVGLAAAGGVEGQEPVPSFEFSVAFPEAIRAATGAAFEHELSRRVAPSPRSWGLRHVVIPASTVARTCRRSALRDRSWKLGVRGFLPGLRAGREQRRSRASAMGDYLPFPFLTHHSAQGFGS